LRILFCLNEKLKLKLLESKQKCETVEFGAFGSFVLHDLSPAEHLLHLIYVNQALEILFANSNSLAPTGSKLLGQWGRPIQFDSIFSAF
jgi:hypothetical protein